MNISIDFTDKEIKDFFFGYILDPLYDINTQQYLYKIMSHIFEIFYSTKFQLPLEICEMISKEVFESSKTKIEKKLACYTNPGYHLYDNPIKPEIYDENTLEEIVDKYDEYIIYEWYKHIDCGDPFGENWQKKVQVKKGYDIVKSTYFERVYYVFLKIFHFSIVGTDEYFLGVYAYCYEPYSEVSWEFGGSIIEYKQKCDFKSAFKNMVISYMEGLDFIVDEYE
jgi:hypothetical protein